MDLQAMVLGFRVQGREFSWKCLQICEAYTPHPPTSKTHPGVSANMLTIVVPVKCPPFGKN